MKCLKCSHQNPGTVGYCQKCGAKLDFTADEIQGALIEKKREEVADNTEFYARQAITFAGVLFLVAVTCFGLSLGSPDIAPPAIPSAANGSKYMELEYKGDLEIPKLQVPLEVRKK
jgi:uncharacterized membrane protein YvbJ